MPSNPNIFDCDHIFDLPVLLNGIPDHGLNTNTQIFKAVHLYIAARKHCQVYSHGTLSIFPHRFFIEFSCFCTYIVCISLDLVLGRELK